MYDNFKILILLLSWNFGTISCKAIKPTLAHVAIEQVNHGYECRVKVQDRLQQLKLTKPGSVFADNFAFITAKNGPKDQIVFQPTTPSESDILDMEDNLHVDHEARAAVRIKKSKRGFEMHGVINGMHITHDRQSHVATMLRDEDDSKNRFRDYVEVNGTLTFPPNYNAHRGGPESEDVTRVNVELFVVLDNKQWTNLGDDHVLAMEYVAILVHGVNAFYNFAEDPKIKFKVVGLLTMNTTDQQPFMESARILRDNDAAFDMGKTLAGFASYMFQHSRILPPYDVAVFISGEEFKTYNETTESWEKGIVGLAHRKAACLVNEESEKAFKTAVVKDIGAFWRGSHPITHELAHLLGAPHDGESGAESCSYEDGYIMSYTGWGSPNRFHFSKCSNQLMKIYINSNQGTCLREDQAPRSWNETSLYSGNKLTMDELCRKLNGGKDNFRASSTKTPKELCRMISCERCFKTFFGEVCGITGSEAFNMMPGEHTPCGKDGGKCIEGDCINLDKPT